MKSKMVLLLAGMFLFLAGAARAGSDKWGWVCSVDTIRTGTGVPLTMMLVPYEGAIAVTTADANSAGRIREKVFFPIARYGTNAAGALKAGARKGNYFRIHSNGSAGTPTADTLHVSFFNRAQTDTTSKSFVLMLGVAATGTDWEMKGVEFDSVRVAVWGAFKNFTTFTFAGEW